VRTLWRVLRAQQDITIAQVPGVRQTDDDFQADDEAQIPACRASLRTLHLTADPLTSEAVVRFARPAGQSAARCVPPGRRRRPTTPRRCCSLGRTCWSRE
jgi:hypothetical protein